MVTKTLKNLFQNHKWAIPTWLLVLTILAFGLLTPTLGFYFDDWPVIYMIQSGANFWDFYQFDRPFSAWTYVLTAPILGTSPFLWHTFTMLLRWTTTLLLWWVLGLIWPGKKKETTWIAMLFAVHPVFLQQSIAVAYSQHFITYGLFFLSCWAMLRAALRKGRRWVFIGISVLSGILQIFTMEYFWGLELVRPLLLWLAFTNQGVSGAPRTKKTLAFWAPYLVVLLGAITWRVGFYNQQFAPGEDPNALRLLVKLAEAPLQGTINLLEKGARDFVFLMITVWADTIRPELVMLGGNYIGLSWILVVFTFFLGSVFRRVYDPPDVVPGALSNRTWNWQLNLLGLSIFILGTMPVWLTDKYIHSGMYADRFALPGMWGASLLVVGLLSWIGISYKPRTVLLTILISLAIGTQFRVANEYRWDWVNQKRFFWQLHWRAPELEPNTAILSEGTLFSFVGEYPTAFAINTFYEAGSGDLVLPFWFIELDSGFHSDPVSYLEGIPLSQSLRNYSFTGDSLANIVLEYDPENGNCLWVLDEEDRVNTELPGLTWEALPLSDLDRILTDGASTSPPKTIFGSEPVHTWCYFYQKADAAHQAGDWEEVLGIEDTLKEQGYEPNNKLEWIPFIDAYANLGKWREAADLTLSAYERSAITRKTFCNLWASFSSHSIHESVDEEIISDVIRSLGCQ